MSITIQDKADYQLFLTSTKYAAGLRDRDPETFGRFLKEATERNPEVFRDSGFHANELGKRNKPLYREIRDNGWQKPEKM